MNCCGGTTETKKEDKQAGQENGHSHSGASPSEHSHAGCGMHGGWMQRLWIGLLVLLAASYFMK